MVLLHPILLGLLFLTKAGGILPFLPRTFQNAILYSKVSALRGPSRHPHHDLSVDQLVRAHGYPCEVHQVTTEDGYILTMYRIPDGYQSRETKKKNFKHTKRKGKFVFSKKETTTKRVAMLQHCVHCSSYDFILNDRHQALAFIMADAGYDVWLGNFRGTEPSRQHTVLDPNGEQFWKFNVDHLAAYDLPAMMDHVLNTTRSSRLYYVGHSMGCMTFFAMMQLFPHYNEKVITMAAMAPVATMGDIKGPMRQVWLFMRDAYRSFEEAGKGEVLGKRDRIVDATRLCSVRSPFLELCKAFLPSLSGVNRGYADKEYLNVLLAYSPAATSARLLGHLGQLIHSGRFQQFDYGTEGNKQHYGGITPPVYNISKVTVPVGVFWSENDFIADPTDVGKIIFGLTNLHLNYRVPLDDFNHMDFLHAENAVTLVYHRLMDFLDGYS